MKWCHKWSKEMMLQMKQSRLRAITFLGGISKVQILHTIWRKTIIECIKKIFLILGSPIIVSPTVFFMNLVSLKYCIISRSILYVQYVVYTNWCTIDTSQIFPPISMSSQKIYNHRSIKRLNVKTIQIVNKIFTKTKITFNFCVGERHLSWV